MTISSIGFTEGIDVEIAAHEITEGEGTKLVERVAPGVGSCSRTSIPSFVIGPATGMATGGLNIEGLHTIGLHIENETIDDSVSVRVIFSDECGDPAFVTEEVTFYPTSLSDARGQYLFTDVAVRNFLGAKYMTLLVTVPPTLEAVIYTTGV